MGDLHKKKLFPAETKVLINIEPYALETYKWAYIFRNFNNKPFQTIEEICLRNLKKVGQTM